jgi:hypothetical protein
MTVYRLTNEHQGVGSHFIDCEIATLWLVRFRSEDCEFVTNPVPLGKCANQRTTQSRRYEIRAGLQGLYPDGIGP